VEIIVLGDGPDLEMSNALVRLPSLRQLTTAEALGPPACFNRLAAESDAEVILLLEGGAVPAAGAIASLVAALERDRTAGIAGPSTNFAGKPQGVVTGRYGERAVVERDGQAVRTRFGATVHTLQRPDSLAGFCYAVRRALINRIGGADERYGSTPGWEEDYGGRARHAGFTSVWVCGVYVHRPPPIARGNAGERARHEYGERRDHLQLPNHGETIGGRGARALHLPPDSRSPDDRRGWRTQLGHHQALRRPSSVADQAAVSLDRVIHDPAECPIRPDEFEDRRLPLVTCIMPTRDRVEFALQAVHLFFKQDYRSRELVIVDDGDDDRLRSLLPPDPRIRYLRLRHTESIGAKRNRACAVARGQYIAQWDDDDWYGTQRLSVQLAPLLAGRADMTALANPVILDLPEWRCWTVTPALHRRLFVEDVLGGTLVYRLSWWQRGGGYPDASLAEDAAFLAHAKVRGARLWRVQGEGLFMYVRHEGNAWSFRCGDHQDPGGWRPVKEPILPVEDRKFYVARFRRRRRSRGHPLVTCIMPTRNRRPFVARAVDYFRRQDYPARELLILDDGEDSVADLVPGVANVRYVRLDHRLVLGGKRNRACELAHGEIIVHWDDDDWHAPNRISYQVEQLWAHGATVSGPSRVLYFDPVMAKAWLYDHGFTTGRRSWVSGNALCYLKRHWHENRFPECQVGEDEGFLRSRHGGDLLVLRDHRFIVGLVHARNTSPKLTSAPCWRARPVSEVRALLDGDYDAYAWLGTWAAGATDELAAGLVE